MRLFLNASRLSRFVENLEAMGISVPSHGFQFVCLSRDNFYAKYFISDMTFRMVDPYEFCQKVIPERVGLYFMDLVRQASYDN